MTHAQDIYYDSKIFATLLHYYICLFSCLVWAEIELTVQMLYGVFFSVKMFISVQDMIHIIIHKIHSFIVKNWWCQVASNSDGFVVWRLAQPMNQFQPVWQSRQQAVRAYCPNFYNVLLSHLTNVSHCTLYFPLAKPCTVD